MDGLIVNLQLKKWNLKNWMIRVKVVRSSKDKTDRKSARRLGRSMSRVSRFYSKVSYLEGPYTTFNDQ